MPGVEYDAIEQTGGPPGAVDRLRQTSERLHDGLDKLSKRLEPVMTMGAPIASDKLAEAPGSELEDAIARVGYACERLEVITARLVV